MGVGWYSIGIGEREIEVCDFVGGDDDSGEGRILLLLRRNSTAAPRWLRPPVGCGDGDSVRLERVSMIRRRWQNNPLAHEKLGLPHGLIRRAANGDDP